MNHISRYLLTVILLFATLRRSTSQNSRQPIIHNAIHPPIGLAVGSYINSVTQDEAFVGWIPNAVADSYTLRLYTREDDVLQREITNIKIPVMVISDLDTGTNYSITVSSVLVNANGLLIESVESAAFNFTTREECMGGQIWTECDGACIARCDDPDPVCSRVCQPGCNCPVEINVWNGQMCGVAEFCPTERGFPVTVENFHVVNSASTHFVLGWDIHLGAYIYEVTVRLADNRSVIVQILTSNIPIIQITGLNPGVVYIFGVVAFVRNVESITSRSALLPPRFRISRTGATSFTVTWDRDQHSVRFSFVLYDETKENVIYENDKIGGTSIMIERLAPGTVYFFSVAAAGPNEDIGIASPKTRVKTLGQKQGNDNPLEAVLEQRIELPTTTVRPIVTTTNITHCLQQYQAVERFRQNSPDSRNSQRYPNCQDNGLYVTTLCEEDDPTACYCIREDNGEKKKGSHFGGRNSHFPLDCDRYGDLEIENLNLQLGEIRSSTIEVTWDSVPEAQSYIVYWQNQEQLGGDRTIAVNAALNKYTLENLLPGNSYEIGIYVVESNGGASSLVTVQTATTLVDTPEGLRVLTSLPENFTVQWSVSSSDEAYSIRLILKDTQAVVEEHNQVLQRSITFRNVTVLKTYIVEIRAVGLMYGDDGEPSLQYSDPATIEGLINCDLPPIDIIFAIESSGPTTWHELQAMKGLSANLMRALPRIKGDEGTRVAALRFNQGPNYIFNYDRFKATGNSVGALRYIRYLDGRAPQVGEMMRGVTEKYFTNPANQGYRRRPNALSVVVVFTSGRTTRSLSSTPYSSYTTRARILHRYTNVISIGVDKWSNPAVLEQIASSQNLRIMAASFEELETSVDIVLEKLCLINPN